MSVLKTSLLEIFAELSGILKYEILKEKYYPNIPRTINIKLEEDKKYKTILAQAPEYPGLVTLVKNKAELVDKVNDAIYTYFGVPRYIAKKWTNQFFPEGSGNSFKFEASSKFAVA